MIEKKNLRIGNWITCEYGTYQVTELLQDGLNLPHVEGLPYEEANGVLLTEEWLIKGGFEKLPHSFSIERFRLTKQDHSDYWFTAFNSNSAHINKLKYVHELQNLTFCLTGEELTFNLK